MEDQRDINYVYRGGATDDNTNTVEVLRSVAFIDDRAFENWGNLRYITIPNTVTGIGDQAFGHCTSLAYVTLPPSLTRVIVPSIIALH